MATLSGFTYFPLEMTKKGEVHDAGQLAAVRTGIGAPGVTDLLVLSHGWNNDMAEAGALYEELLGNLGTLIERQGGSRSSVAVLGVLWPSKKFADDELIPANGGGGIAAAGGGELPADRLVTRLDELKGMFDGPDEAALEEAKTLLDSLEDSPNARDRFVDLLRSLLPASSDTEDDASDRFRSATGNQILKSLQDPIQLTAAAAGGGTTSMGDDDTARPASGGPAGLGDLFSGFKAAAWKLLNYTTYYQMKERAGVVGAGLNGVLGGLRALRPDLRIHLVGHSFGARVVTAAAAAPVKLTPSSLSLLQGAFSHNGFAANIDNRGVDGFFRNVMAERRIAGPIVATHTVNDKAVGLAYAVASRVSGDIRSAFGDADDLYGGIGRNGAVRMAAGDTKAMQLLPETGTYTLTAGIIHNLLADPFIDDHSDVRNIEVANAVLAAMRG